MIDPKTIERVLITGVAGSGGSYLAEYIVENHPGVEVHGIKRWHSTTPDNLAGIAKQLTLHEADLMDLSSVFSVVNEVQPEVIFHLAAYANVQASFVTPNRVLSNNILGTSNLLEAIRMAKVDPVIQLCSTSEVYGQVDPKDVPTEEDASMNPVSPYAVSKAAQELLGWSYFVSCKMRIICTRMCTYINPRRADLFATSFAKQIAWIERGLQEELVHGNLSSVRTIIDVRDAVRAYWEAILFCEPGEVYNIGGSESATVGEILQRLVAMAEKPIPSRTDPNLLRPVDLALQIPSVEKFMKATGWKPHYTIDKSLSRLLSHWRGLADKAVREATWQQNAGREK